MSWGCSGPRTVHVGLAQPDAHVSLHPGDELVVELASNHTTGYGWQVVDSGAPVLEAVGEPIYTPEPEPRIGGGGMEAFRFRAAQPGSTTLTLDYRRPWEAAAPPAKSVTYHVEVSER